MRFEKKVRGIKMVYDDLGQGDVILLIHGQPFNRNMWKYQVEEFSKNHRLIIPDLRGYGESGITEGIVLLDEIALDLLCLLEDLNISKATVIGLSMGGQIALELYKLRPDLFQSIILADTEARAEDEKGYESRINLSKRILEDGMKKFTQERIKHFMCDNTFKSKPEIVNHLTQMMITTSPAGSAAVQRGRAERLDYTPLLKRIDFPALIIVGALDEFTPIESAEYMHQRITNSKLVIIENCGHVSNMEQPEEFNRALKEFLN